MEYVDIVNENDEVINTVSKQEAHEKGLLHRTVIAEVINSNGEFVLIEQSATKQDAGKIVSPIGGHVEAGETEDEALKREAFEEFGLAGFDFKLIGKAILNREVIQRKENHLFILYEIYTDAKPVLNEESVSYTYYTPQKLSNDLKNNPEKFGDAFHFVVKNFYQELLK